MLNVVLVDTSDLFQSLKTATSSAQGAQVVFSPSPHSLQWISLANPVLFTLWRDAPLQTPHYFLAGGVLRGGHGDASPFLQTSALLGGYFATLGGAEDAALVLVGARARQLARYELGEGSPQICKG